MDKTSDMNEREGSDAPAGSPVRVQRKRTKGWRKPPNTVIVDRTSRYGNPFKVGDDVPGLKGVPMDAEDAVHWFEVLHLPKFKHPERIRGKNLACFCPLDQPCHADVLLRWANAPHEPRA